MTRLLLTLPIFILSAFSGQAQTDSLKFPSNAKFPDKFQKAIKEQTKEYDRLFYRDSTTTKHYSGPFMLDKIDNDSNYHYIFLAEYWIAFHYQDIIPELINRVTNKKEFGLVNSADLIIWERVQAKQMQFYGHGRISNDDLFTIAGRANRLLTKITGETFGHVSMYSTQEQLVILQGKWINWLKGL
ncbi:MAG TPA: hypothetical protein VIZ28_16665 [Chitinophagaceae bacterium]